MRNRAATNKTKVVALTTDTEFEQSVRATFSAGGQIDLIVVNGTVAANEQNLSLDATVIVLDLDAARHDEMVRLERLRGRLNGRAPVVVITQTFDKDVARQLLQMRIADFLVKPVSPVELVRACARVASDTNKAAADTATEAQIFTFLPAV